MVLTCGAGIIWAQGAPAGQGAAAPEAVPLPGPQVLSVSAYAAYYSSGLPETGATGQTGASNLPADGGGGGSIVFGWSKFTGRTSFSLNYTPSYTADVRYSSLDALNHAFSFNISRKLTPRWTFGFSTAANYSTLEESLFASTATGNVASVPSNFSQLSTALLSGNFTNNQQLGVALTNSSLVQSPLATLLYGQRMFTSSAQTTLSHSLTPHLSVTFSGGGSRSQYASQNQSSIVGNPSLINNTTSGTAGVSLSYSLSPVSQIGGTATTNWVTSSIENMITTTSMATFGRTLAKRWIVQLHGGVGVISPTGQSSSALPNQLIATGANPVFGGSLVFKTTSHTFLGSLDHVTSDSYGVGASSTNTATVTWQWRRPGRRWSMQSSFSWQQLQGGALSNTSGWHVTAGANRAFGPHLAMLLQYTYLKYSGGLQGSFYNFSESAIRISTIWTPRSTALR